jgi:tripartite-type tricarboxylate transporter receptor subunit TctC
MGINMALDRRRFLHMTAGGVFSPALSHSARALDYPTRPLRWVVGFPPGGGSDIVARIIGRSLSERLGQQVIIENKPGAGTNIAVQAVINSAPDGYTLLWVGTSNAINVTLYASLPFDFLKAIAPVAGLVVYPMVIEVTPALPARSIAELIALAKANPGKITMASYGTGTISHVAGELFKTMSGVDMVHVPYRGGAPMVNDLMGGQVQVALDVVASSLPHIQSGAVRALGVTSTTRLDALPDIATVGETVPGYEALVFTGVGAPRGTPDAIIALLNREINAALADPDIKMRLTGLAVTPLVVSPAAFGAYMKSQADKWAKVIKSANIKVE